VKRSLQSTSAFSLVEITLALGIAAFCLLAVFGLMPVGVQTNRNATSQTAATNIIAAVIADIRATPAGNSTSLQFGIPIGTSSPPLYFDDTGQVAPTIGVNSRYQLNVTWNPSTFVGLFYADLKVSWPAAASPANPSGSVEMFAAIDRN
jgi:uncharacterized protein (TIGR02598 family)